MGISCGICPKKGGKSAGLSEWRATEPRATVGQAALEICVWCIPAHLPECWRAPGSIQKALRATAMDNHLLWPECPLQLCGGNFLGWRRVWGALSVSHGEDAKGLGCAAGSSWPIRWATLCEALRTLLLLTVAQDVLERTPARCMSWAQAGDSLCGGHLAGQSTSFFLESCPVPCEPPCLLSLEGVFPLLLRPRSTLSISSSSLGTRRETDPGATQLGHPGRVGMPATQSVINGLLEAGVRGHMKPEGLYHGIIMQVQ